MTLPTWGKGDWSGKDEYKRLTVIKLLIVLLKLN